MYEDLKVLKRDNKKTDFNGEKIAIAIKKSFDSREEFIEKYNEEDINKVYLAVLDDIYDNFFETPYIKVENIQDTIEKMLIKLDYKDVYESFSNYRDKRTESRKMFLSEPKQHKLLKAIEKITLKQDWSKKDNITPTDIIYSYGKIISEEFSSAYLLNSKYIELHESGQIHIDNIEYISVGTTESCTLDINKIMEKGFHIENIYYKPPSDITSYLELVSIIVRRNCEEQHGNQGIPSFDSMMKNILITTFKEELKNKLYDFLDLSGYSNFVDFDSILRDISKIESLEVDIKHFYKYSNDVQQIRSIIDMAYKKALESTEVLLYKSIYNFSHHSNYKVNDRIRTLTIDIGTDTSFEGRMITKNYLLSLDEMTIPKTVFKLKKGINYDEEDTNYDLFNQVVESITRGCDISISYSDFSSNIIEYENNIESEVFYFDDGIRIIDNVLSDKNNVFQRGVLSRTYINIARLGIKNSKLLEKEEDLYEELDNIINMVVEQLYERFIIQSDKKASEFQFLIGENIYMDSKGIKQGEKIRKSIRNGLLCIGVIGLNECIESLKYNVDPNKILGHIQNRINQYKNQYKLNYVLIGPGKKISNAFIDIDRAIYGDIEGITDKESYDNNFVYSKDDNQFQFDGGFLYEKENNFNNKEDILSYIKSQNLGFINFKKKVED